MKKLALLLLLIALPLRADELPAFASGTFASGTWASGTWGVAEAPTTVEVPNVVGQASFAAADTILVGVGLDGGTETEVCSAEADNEIVGQSPSAGVEVALGTLVNLRSSNGVACPPAGGAEFILRNHRR